ncbi:hypothetical protein CFO_g5223 [Ceratocystis platani]|uniref:Uncharacterized protein n=1 Tax=Ceratocystis fimbriata f. sp. platani TaxID=88771 RepID=A0A0F8AZN0_CERFI|nr:hypothetical protein CFO_g5223 [Ceratocystis platani]
MLNEHNVLDSNEALLSIWEREAKLSAGRLQRIKYYDVNEMSDVSTFNNIFQAFGYDPNADEGIPEIKIARDDTAHQHLRETTFGSEAIDICTEFKETEGMYIAGFDIGRDGSDGRWIRVNLFMEGDEDDDDE